MGEPAGPFNCADDKAALLLFLAPQTHEYAGGAAAAQQGTVRARGVFGGVEQRREMLLRELKHL